jgi:hypothetical protein
MNDKDIINGANPSIIWYQLIKYLSKKSRSMNREYTKRLEDNNPISWTDLDVVNKQIHDMLDYILTWNESFKNESIHVNRSKLRRIIKESVRKTLYQEMHGRTK